MGTPGFTPEFKLETVRQITERGYSVAEVAEIAEKLNDFAHSLYTWLRSLKPDNSERQVSDLLEARMEILTLTAQLTRGEE